MKKVKSEWSDVPHIVPPFGAEDVQFIVDNMRAEELTKLSHMLFESGLERPKRARDVVGVLVRFGMREKES